MTEDFATVRKIGQHWFVCFNFGRSEYDYAEVNEATARKVAGEANDFIRIQVKEAAEKALWDVGRREIE